MSEHAAVRIMEMVDDTMQPAYVSVWLLEAGNEVRTRWEQLGRMAGFT